MLLIDGLVRSAGPRQFPLRNGHGLCRLGSAGQHAAGTHLPADAGDLPLAFRQGHFAGVDRVIAHHQIVRMRHCGTQHEANIGQCDDGDGRIGSNEDRKLSSADQSV